ncbi:MAG: dipeptide ABC transporter ATP-binding protein [Granulosicoccus sp.]|nr:dipeptide ABC transporter ATP-binding protein [Granulosicoccus sp.]
MSVSNDAEVPLLSVDRLNLSIHDTVILSDISFKLHAGQTLGIIGESGSGKSMTALSIMQLLPRGARLHGNVRFDGHELTTMHEDSLCDLRGGDIGMIFQEPMTALNPVKTIGEQVCESIRLHRTLARQEAWQLTETTLQRVGLPTVEFPLNRYPHELSGGQRQRVVIAIAIACKPRLLIADEPTTALDVTTQAGILDLLRSLQREEGLALVFITHDLAVVSSLANHLLVLKDGRIVEQGQRRDILSKPKESYTETLLQASALTQYMRKRDTQSGAVHNFSESKNPLLTAHELVCEYRVKRRSWFRPPTYFRAVDQVSFTINDSECVGLVGESGCGKSTLTRAILGLMPLRSGRIELAGEAIDSTEPVSHAQRRLMQVVFQDPYGSFNPRHKVQRLVAEPLHVLKTKPSWNEAHELVIQTLLSVGMQASDSDKYIHEFSGGQRQRIAIARALIIKPRLIVLDEAVSALDVSVRAQILELLSKLANDQGLAYLFISHDLSVVQRVTERLLVMKDGKIVEQGPTEKLFSQPSHPYTQQLIRAAPVIKL